MFEEQVTVVMEQEPVQEGEPEQATMRPEQQPEEEPDQAAAGDSDQIMLTVSPLPFVPLPPYAVTRPSMPNSAPLTTPYIGLSRVLSVSLKLSATAARLVPLSISCSDLVLLSPKNAAVAPGGLCMHVCILHAPEKQGLCRQKSSRMHVMCSARLPAAWCRTSRATSCCGCASTG